MDGSTWRVLRALIAFGFGVLLVPIVVAVASYAIELRRMVLEALGSLLKP